MTDKIGIMMEREVMEFDVVIVGSGPVGLTLALEMKKQNIKAMCTI